MTDFGTTGDPGHGLGRTQRRPGERGATAMGKLIWLVILGGVGFGGYKVFQRWQARGGEIFAEAQEVHGRVVPGLVQSNIQGLEALVFADAAQVGHGGRIQRSVMTLYQAVMREAPTLLATRHGQRIVGFGSFALNRAEDDLRAVQQEWLRVRAEVFHDADWFRSR